MKLILYSISLILVIASILCTTYSAEVFPKTSRFYAFEGLLLFFVALYFWAEATWGFISEPKRSN